MGLVSCSMTEAGLSVGLFHPLTLQLDMALGRNILLPQSPGKSTPGPACGSLCPTQLNMAPDKIILIMLFFKTLFSVILHCSKLTINANSILPKSIFVRLK